MTVSEADLEAIVVGTSQLAAMLDVSTTHIADLTRAGVLEPLRKQNGTAVRGRYPLVATVAAFSRYIRTEKGKPGSSAASEAALQAARLRKFQVEALAFVQFQTVDWPGYKDFGNYARVALFPEHLRPVADPQSPGVMNFVQALASEAAAQQQH